MTVSRALVTGGCGFVGRHIVHRMHAMGVHTTVVDNLSTGLPLEKWPRHLKISPGEARAEFHMADIRDYMRSMPADFDLIFHCAAVVGGRLTIEGDPLQVATDLAIDAEFFNWTVKSKPRPRKVIYFSSSAAYPISMQRPGSHHPLAEHHIDFGDSIGTPDMTYGWSKLTGEFLAGHAARTYDLNVVCYRPFSGYGEDQDFTYPFPSVIRRVGNRESPIVVWGSGDQLRDFIYIDDAIDAVLATMDKLAPGDALNLGSGQGTSFRELAEAAGRVIGHRAEVVNDRTKPEGVFARVAECAKLHQWYRATTPLDKGIAIVHEYQMSARRADEASK